MAGSANMMLTYAATTPPIQCAIGAIDYMRSLRLGDVVFRLKQIKPPSSKAAPKPLKKSDRLLFGAVKREDNIGNPMQRLPAMRNLVSCFLLLFMDEGLIEVGKKGFQKIGCAPVCAKLFSSLIGGLR